MVTHVVSIERDISEDRRLREQLIHSERLSAVGQLVAGVAHEINNPLAYVVASLELMISRLPELTGDERPTGEQVSWLHRQLERACEAARTKAKAAA